MIFHPTYYAKPSLFLVLFIATVHSVADTAATAAAALDSVCTANVSQPCLCPGNAFHDHPGGVQFCSPDETGWTECAPCLWYNEWCDEETGLCWQDPPKDSNVQDKHGGVTVMDAIRYCEDLGFGGHNNWRLPTLDELRSLIRDAGVTELICPIRDGSSLGDMTMLDVILCTGRLNSFECAGSGGCCWPETLSGTCNTIDPASTTHYLEYWSSTPAVDDPENWFGFVFFDTGTVGFNHALSFGEVRCVRDNNQRTTTTTTQSSTNVIATAASSTNDDDVCESPMQSCTAGETRDCTCAVGRNGMLAVMAEGVQR